VANGGAQRAGGNRDRSRGSASHLRRYGPFYAIGAVILLVLVLVPVVTGGDDDGDDEATVAAGGSNGDGPWRPASGDLESGTGTTKNGDECGDGDRQIPDTVYSVPCLAEFTGDNGGATSRGVTEDTIKLVFRDFPESANSQTTDQELRDRGLATTEETDAIRDEFAEYLSEHYELYGRRIEVEEYVSQFSNNTSELLGGNREEACQDATQIVEEVGAFGVIGQGGQSGVFSECAAERGLMVFNGGAYYSEDWFRDQHPYVWSSTMDCARFSAHVAEYIGKRLLDKPAKFAGDPELAEKTRTFATYVPENEQYAKCVDITENLVKDEYGGSGSQVIVRYQLDIARFTEQAQRAVVQFKAEGVTTVVTASDPISIAALTTAATEQDYHPEWLTIGTAFADLNSFARGYDQEQVDGHLFGLSQLGEDAAIFGPEGEVAPLYEKMTGEEIPKGTTGEFYYLVNALNLLQAAGPDLTPENVALGAWSLPSMGDQDSAAGVWFYGDSVDGDGGDHTAVQDSKEVYWDADAPPEETEPDQDAQGDYLPTYGGRRFQLGEWPEEEPELGGGT
jgi:Periplasmic binding protein